MERANITVLAEPSRSGPKDRTLADAYIEAAQQTGYSRNDDFNGADQEALVTFNPRPETGGAAAAVSFEPGKGRPNLTASHAWLIEYCLRASGPQVLSIAKMAKG